MDTDEGGGCTIKSVQYVYSMNTSANHTSKVSTTLSFLPAGQLQLSTYDLHAPQKNKARFVLYFTKIEIKELDFNSGQQEVNLY